MPAPSLTRSVELLPLMAAVMTVTLAAPPTVNELPPAVMPPESVRVPESALLRQMIVANVTAPDQVLLLAVLRKAPVVPLVPVPFRLIGSGTVRVPATWTAAPEATVVSPAAVPNALLFATATIPADTTVGPV